MRKGDGATSCRWLDPTQRCVRSLRRYASAGEHLHDASVETGIVRIPIGDDATVPAETPRRRAGDPPWPKACECGYEFKLGDARQVNLSRLYVDSEGHEFTLSWSWEKDPRAAPAGAMWDARWLPAKWRGYDGIALIVRCPNMLDWHVDMPATRSGGRWKRTGDPMRPATLNVSPSIAIGDPAAPNYYHGFLQAGLLTAHIG